VENNMSEMLAVLLGIRALKAFDPSWSGLVSTDSQLTIRRWTQGASLKNIPYDWRRRMGELLRMPGDVGYHRRWTLLDGNPTALQLEENAGKRGHPVSIHNKTCDKLCQQAAVRFQTPGAGSLETLVLSPLDTRAVAV